MLQYRRRGRRRQLRKPSCPEPFAAVELRLDLLLELGRAHDVPVVAELIEQRALPAAREVLEPFERPRLGPGTGRYRDIDLETAPVELCRQQYQPGLVGPHPVG